MLHSHACPLPLVCLLVALPFREVTGAAASHNGLLACSHCSNEIIEGQLSKHFITLHIR
jgi:hypothetical protein